MNKEITSPGDAKRWFRYDSKTGYLHWRKSPSNHVPAGAVAGHVSQSNLCINISIGGQRLKAHRLIWLIEKGAWPDGEIDHINGLKKDNRIENLRDVTHLENGRNLCMSKKNKTGITGVHLTKSTGRYSANIMVRGKTISLYTGNDFLRACCARKSAEIKYGFHVNHGRPAAA